MNHPNIVGFVDFKTDVDYPKKRGGFKKVILIVMELVEGGELFPYLQFTGSFSESICRLFMRQLASALLHCKRNGISHRDIKPENIFVSKDFSLKLGDFGLSAIHEIADNDRQSHLLSSYVGTDSYMAPEIIAGKKYEGEAVDIWSLGVVFFIMLSGFPPLQRADMNDWYFKRLVKRQHDAFWKAHERSMQPLPGQIKDLILKMLEPDSSKRLTLEGLLEHTFMKEGSRDNPEMLINDLRMRRCAVENELRKERRARGKLSEYDVELKNSRNVPTSSDSNSTASFNRSISTVENALSDYSRTGSNSTSSAMDVDEFDPYKEDVWRSIDEKEEKSVDKENKVEEKYIFSIAPPEIESSIALTHIWLPTKMQKDVITTFANTVSQTCKAMQTSSEVKIVKRSDQKVKIQLKMPEGTILISVSFYCASNKTHTIASVTKKCGSSLVLQTVLQNIALRLK